MNPDDSELLKHLAEAIKELKAEHYCGSSEAYTYLKEKRKSLELADNVIPQLSKEFPGARMPGISEIEDLRQQLDLFLWNFFSLKIYGDIDAWNNGGAVSARVESEVNDWLKDNFRKLALEYYRTLLSCASPEHYSKEVVFIKLCGQFLGEIDPALKDELQDDAEGLERDLNRYEAERINQNFNLHQVYQRMANDRLLNRDDYQRLLIATYLEGLGDSYWATLFILKMAATSFPRTYEELMEVERSQLERFTKEYRRNNTEETRYTYEIFSYLNLILRRHRSFVTKLIKEYNSR